MKTIRSAGPAVLVLAFTLAACDRAPTRDTPGQTTTTSAEEAAKQAATDVKEEVKQEWKNLDVSVETKGVSPQSDAGVSRKAR